jgi:hypothetical protein
MPARTRALTTDDDATVDGCDVEFNPSDSTPDTELPQATGGVETVRRRVR